VTDAPRIAVPPPGPRSRELLRRAEGMFYPGTGHGLAPFVVARKDGHTITDVDGNVYLDLISASASVPLGAGRADIVAPAVEALRRYGNEDSHTMASEPMIALAERLLEIVPEGLTRVDLALNGTEAVETAVKMMRRATGRPVVIGFFSQYHGESTTTATLGAEQSDISRGMRTFAPGFAHVPYPHPYRSPLGPPRAGVTGDGTVDYIRDHLLFHALHPGDVAGVIVEPIVGSGGVLVPPDSFWPALEELCREHDWLLCADEVKTGFGRTGRMFAVEHWGVRPDLMCLGKGMGGGVMPIGAVVGTERAMGFDDVPTGSTWAWLPAACAAALRTIEIFAEEDVLGNVRALERVAVEELGRIAERHGQVGDVRVRGCYQAIEFVRDRETRERHPELQERVAREALARGVLADSSTTSYNIQPSLVMPPDDLRRGLGIVGEAVDAAVTELARWPVAATS
jgi:4-aminobutyrate aminotransferase-like enzyme